MSQAMFRSFGVVRKCAPDKIIGFGGYGAFPVVMAGALMRCPVLIHEQNVVPGKANALLSKIVKKVAISFEGSRKYLDPCQGGVDRLSLPSQRCYRRDLKDCCFWP